MLKEFKTISVENTEKRKEKEQSRMFKIMDTYQVDLQKAAEKRLIV